MGRIWSDQRKYETWLQVEAAAAEAMSRAGIVPPDAARDIRERGAFDIARIEQIEEVTLKKRKLQIKDRMEDILRRHRQP